MQILGVNLSAEWMTGRWIRTGGQVYTTSTGFPNVYTTVYTDHLSELQK